MTGLADSNQCKRPVNELTLRERNWLGDHGMAQIEAKFDRLAQALLAHHELSTLSDEVIREYDYRECPVCRRARGA